MSIHPRLSIFLIYVPAFFLLLSCELVDNPCVRGTGDVVRQEVALSDINGINFGMAGNVYIYRGSEQRVEIEAQANIISQIQTEVSEGTWTILPRECVSNYQTLNIYVTVPAVSSIALTGSGSIVVEDSMEVAEADILLSGSGNITFLGTTETTDVLHSGSGKVTLKGSADFMDVQLSGSGSVQAFDMVAAEARVNLSGSGRVEVSFADSLMATVSGSGYVYYRGNGSLVHQTVTGSGGVEAATN